MIGALVLGLVALISACGGGGSSGTATEACTPNEPASCVGVGGCSGTQTCNADGSGYGACSCGAADAAIAEAGVEGGTDATIGDAAEEVGVDGSADAAPDASTDAMADVASEAGPDAMTDAGDVEDAGLHDAAVDASDGSVVACTSGQRQCVDSSHYETCSAGQWSNPVVCTNQACEAGACVGVCSPGETGCNGQQPQTCNVSGAWQNNGGACVTQTCVLGSCTGVCAPEQTRCSGGGVETCDASGQWGTAAACSGTTPVCVNGACAACTPNTTRCYSDSPGALETCNTSGQWGAPVACSGSTPDCVSGACVECSSGGTQCPSGQYCNQDQCSECTVDQNWATDCPTGTSQGFNCATAIPPDPSSWACETEGGGLYCCIPWSPIPGCTVDQPVADCEPYIYPAISCTGGALPSCPGCSCFMSTTAWCCSI